MNTENLTYQKPVNEQLITYEQPLNEHVRLYLRLEHLFNQLHHQLHSRGVQASRLALETLLKIVDLADRPDLKSKLLQTLHQQSNTLRQLKNLDHIKIDTNILQKILHHLDVLINDLHHHSNSKLGDEIRQNSFLKNIRLHLNNPAGPCNFNIPAYALWLHQPENKRLASLNSWSKEFEILKTAVLLILSLTRESIPPQRAIAENRFYQQPLDSNLPCQLIRIALPIDYNLYPEFSVGKHRLSVQFKSFSTDSKHYNTLNTKNKIPFDLYCCRV